MPSFAEVMRAHIDNTIEKYNTEYEVPTEQIKLDGVNKNLLAHKILHIPTEYLTILLMKYYFQFDNDVITKITDKQYVYGHLHYINELLITAMGLPEKSYIHADTLKSACRMAMNKYGKCAPDDDMQIEPQYSYKFRKALKVIPAAQIRYNMVVIIARRAAMVALIIIIAFAATLTVSAELRERFFEWVRNTFPQYTEFGAAYPPGVIDVEAYAELLLMRPHYIPEGFQLLGEPFYSPTSVLRTYIDASGNTITFMAAIPDGTLAGFDTEDATVYEIEFLGQPAFIWERQGITYFIWQQYGLECSLIANLSTDVLINIADSVQLYNNQKY